VSNYWIYAAFIGASNFTQSHIIWCPVILHINRIWISTALKKLKKKVIRLQAVKTYRRSRGVMAPILTLGTRWRWVVNFISWSLCPRTYCTGGWVGLRASPDTSRTEKSLLLGS